MGKKSRCISASPSSQKITHKFDPVKGCQVPSTGITGAFFILTMIAAYAVFKTKILKNGGPPILRCLSFFPEWAQFGHINREYFDIAAIIILGFMFMTTWEFLTGRMKRLITLSVAAAGIILLSFILNGARLFFNSNTAWFMGWEWTRFEVALAGIFAGLITLWLVHIIHWLSSQNRPLANPTGKALKTALFRWLAGLLLFTLIFLVFLTHPFYHVKYYENWRITVSYIYLAYLFLGLPYAFFTNLLRKSLAEDRKDPGFIILFISRSVFRRLTGSNKRGFSAIFGNRVTLIVLRDIGVKFFFIPLMTTFLFIECGGFFNHFPMLVESIKSLLQDPMSFINSDFTPGKVNPPGMLFNQFYHSAFHGIFIMDVGLSLIGYICTFRWLNNKSKSVDPTLSGWMAALICYPPFNSLTTDYMPYNKSFGDIPYLTFSQYSILDNYTALALMDVLDVALKLFILAVFSIYVWATMAFGLRFSNLTNRGIITRGPYSWVRHPAYISKNLAWWAESVRSFSSPWQVVFLAAWNLIYFLRAFTEERHLMKDPDYVIYCSRVKYRFIPGIF